jgi:hypothetical protein
LQAAILDLKKPVKVTLHYRATGRWFAIDSKIHDF